MGADETLGYENLKDALKQATGGKGVDVAYDAVGGDAFDALSRSMGWGGRLLVIGFASGRIPQLPVNLTARHGRQAYPEALTRRFKSQSSATRELFPKPADGYRASLP
jgi:NADPH:quinone reductase-like Zn-dependent oxidoreductase